MATTTTRAIGHCQLCGHDQKLARGRLVRHGYRRPGGRALIGRCKGTGAPPYEVSCERLRELREDGREALAYHEDYLAKIKRGEVKSFTQLVRTKRGMEQRESSASALGEVAFQRALDELRSNVENEIRSDRSEIAYMTARIDAWRPKETRTVNEHERERKTAEERAERSRLRQEKEAQRSARVTEAEGKRQATRARRAAEGAEILRQLRELAAMADQSEARRQAVRLAKKLRSTHRWFWEENFDKDPTFEPSLLRLGLAEMRDRAEYGGTGMYAHYLF